MASTKDMMWFPGVCFPGSVCAKASGLGMVRQYPVAVQLFLPSPLVGEGGEIERSEMKPDEGSASAERDPSPGSNFATLIRATLSHKGRGKKSRRRCRRRAFEHPRPIRRSR